jgi:hypothetical protein
MIKFLLHFIFMMACLSLFCPPAGWSESSQLSEYEVKAAYIYNFAKYVEWPAASVSRESSSLTICIVGKSPMNEVIESLAGKAIKNRRIVVRNFSRIEDLGECNIVFINATVKTSLNQLLASMAARPILTVSDSKGFAAAGGMIEFVAIGDKIRFEINNRAAQQVNVRVSSHLLRLARTVIE